METKNKNHRRNHSGRWIRRALWGTAIAAAAAGLVYAWLPKPVQVDMEPARVDAMQVSVDEDGQTRVKERHLVSAPLAGNMARIELKAGDRIDRGAVLARILPVEPALLDARTKAGSEARVQAATAAQKQARSTIDRAKIALEQTEKETDRVRDLAKTGSVAAAELERAELLLRARREELQSAELGAKVADHELEVARAALRRVQGPASGEQFEVTSPISGAVLRIVQQSEGVVMPGAPLVELGDPASLEIVVDVLTADAINIRPGARVSIERWGGEPLRAHVRNVEPSAFTKLSALGVEESRVNAIIDLDEPRTKWEGLGDGYRVEARVTIWEAPDALVVPDGALFRDGESWAVFAVRDGKAELTHVEVGRKNGRVAQVVRGLQAGDRVILHPSDRVVHGVRVAPRRS